jgi:Holliday junction resolvasome RuvABC endonuclease subunit
LKRGESPGMRYIRFTRWLEDLITLVRPGLIVYEQTISRGVLASAPQEILNGLATRVQELCARHALEHCVVYPSTLKKFTTGRGNCDKTDMLIAVNLRWKDELRVEEITDHNEADAIALLYFALTEYQPSSPALRLQTMRLSR